MCVGTMVLPRTCTFRVPLSICARRGHTVSGFIEAMVHVAMGRVDCHFVATFLEAHGRIDDKTLSAAWSERGTWE
jgi:hypothetical protein